MVTYVGHSINLEVDTVDTSLASLDVQQLWCSVNCMVRKTCTADALFLCGSRAYCILCQTTHKHSAWSESWPREAESTPDTPSQMTNDTT